MAEPRVVAATLADIYAAMGPLYRRAVRTLAENDSAERFPVGVRAVLEVLELTGPLPVPRLAAHLELARQVVQRTVDDAVARGLVERRTNPRHRRSSLIALSGDGRHAIEAVRAGERVALEPVARTIDPDDADACLRVLRQLLADLRGGADRGVDRVADESAPGQRP